jgi:hypothetical protein
MTYEGAVGCSGFLQLRQLLALQRNTSEFHRRFPARHH